MTGNNLSRMLYLDTLDTFKVIAVIRPWHEPTTFTTKQMRRLRKRRREYFAGKPCKCPTCMAGGMPDYLPKLPAPRIEFYDNALRPANS